MQTWSARLKYFNEAGRNEVESALIDPGLMDVRRPIALAEVVLTNTPLLPSEEAVRRLARRRVAAQVGESLICALRELRSATDPPEWRESIDAVVADLLEPQDADLEEARVLLHDKSMSLLAKFSKRQVDAVKTLEWSKVIREQALPLLGEFGLKLTQVLRKYVAEDKLAACLADVRQAITVTLGELAQARDGKAP